MTKLNEIKITTIEMVVRLKRLERECLEIAKICNVTDEWVGPRSMATWCENTRVKLLKGEK